MSPETILQIIRLSLELALEMARGMTPEQKQKFWERHERNMEFWEDLFKGLQPKSTAASLPK